MMKEILDFADVQSNFGCLGVRLHDLEGRFCQKVSVLFRMYSIVLRNYLLLFIEKKNQKKDIIEMILPETDIAEVDVITGAFC